MCPLARISPSPLLLRGHRSCEELRALGEGDLKERERRRKKKSVGSGERTGGGRNVKGEVVRNGHKRSEIDGTD